MEHLAARLATIPGVVAVTLGGSRAQGTADDTSDWDFGLYYRGTIDPGDVRALGFEGRVFAPHEWGPVVNGGAWLTVDGAKVDLIYRDLDEVTTWVRDADAGRFRIHREVGYVAGVPTYVVAGELAIGRVLHGELPRVTVFPDALRASAPPVWENLALGALQFADAHARRGDVVGCVANASQAVLAAAHARLCAAGRWALNEKRLVGAAGLGRAAVALRERDDLPALVDAVGAALGPMGTASAWRE